MDYTTLLKLKKEFEQEKEKLEEEVSNIIKKSKRYLDLCLVPSDTFGKLKEIAPILNGELLDEPGHNIEYNICEHCKPQFPIIEISHKSSTEFFANPPSFSSFEFYLTINIQKDSILRKIQGLYNSIKDTNKKSISKEFNNWYNGMNGIIDILDKVGKEFQIKIVKDSIKGDTSYLLTLCEKCEKDLLETIKKDSVGVYKEYLSRLGLKESDYNLNLRVEKRTIW